MHHLDRRRWRKDSVFTAQFRPLDRNLKAKLVFLAEALDRNTHTPGRHGGIIGRSGLAVLRALLFQFHNVASGRCDPSLAELAKAANVARSTAQEAVKRLELAGLVERVRRIMRVTVALICPVSGKPYAARRVVQDTNAYRLNVPFPDRVEHGDLARTIRRASSDTGTPSETNTDLNSMPDLFAGFHDNALKNALDRLNHAVTKRALTA